MADCRSSVPESAPSLPAQHVAVTPCGPGTLPLPCSSGVVITPANTPRTLLDLPQEVQDSVFDLAYPRVNCGKYIDKRHWDKRERDHRSTKFTHARRPFPEPKVSEWLVNKKFFVSAARAFIGNQRFCAAYITAHHLPFNLVSYREDGSAVSAFLTELIDEPHMLKHNMSSLPSRRVLGLKVTKEDTFEVIEPKCVWEEELNDEDLRRVIATLGLDKLSGLKSVTLSERYDYSMTPEQQAMWQNNIRKLQDALLPLATRARTKVNCTNRHATGQVSMQWTPLYPGSKVSMLPYQRESARYIRACGRGDKDSRPQASESISSKAKTERMLYDDEVREANAHEISSPSGVAAQTGRLKAEDVPETVEQLQALLTSNGAALVDWIIRMKNGS